MSKETFSTMSGINNDHHHRRMFFLNGMGGSEKTFLHNTLMHPIRGQGKQGSPVACTGIAANLLIGGRTYHSQFSLRVPLVESRSEITAYSVAGKILKETSLIIWDQISH